MKYPGTGSFCFRQKHQGQNGIPLQALFFLYLLQALLQQSKVCQIRFGPFFQRTLEALRKLQNLNQCPKGLELGNQYEEQA